VFVLDGAGNFLGTSAALRQAVAEDRVPLAVETFEWSHGDGRLFADQIDYAHAREEGCALAARIRAQREAFPAGKVYLIGHSAGCGVELATAEALPPGYVDRAVLLAPDISACYDLRPALRSCRIDVFYSERDRAILGLGTTLLGTADRHRTAAAGRVGFRPVVERPEDPALYTRLRQHPWDPVTEWTGNNGGHYGSYEVPFLRAYVLPLLVD
jgi:pimeloyl-ACP methyl ester carboxylesterase